MSQAFSSDNTLIMRLRLGDEHAATEFYDRYVRRVYGLVHQQMGDHLRAKIEPDDIVQSVFKSIFRGLTSGDYNAPQGGSLWHLVAIVAVHKVRGNARRRMAGKRDERRNQSLDSLQNFEAASGATAGEFELAIREAIEGLKPAEQEVVMLRVQGYSIEEISNKLQRSRRGIERNLHTVREKLIQFLEDDEFSHVESR